MGDKVEDAPFPLTDVDRWVLSQTDEEFKYHDWEELREIIGAWDPFPQQQVSCGIMSELF